MDRGRDGRRSRKPGARACRCGQSNGSWASTGPPSEVIWRPEVLQDGSSGWCPIRRHRIPWQRNGVTFSLNTYPDIFPDLRHPVVRFAAAPYTPRTDNGARNSAFATIAQARPSKVRPVAQIAPRNTGGRSRPSSNRPKRIHRRDVRQRERVNCPTHNGEQARQTFSNEPVGTTCRPSGFFVSRPRDIRE